MDREIAIKDDPTITEADELYVWFHRDQTFKLVSYRSFPRNNSGYCKLCPANNNKSNGRLYYCQGKIQTWEAFKCHLPNAERIIGELIAFPTTIESLPPKSNYIKYRNYGNLHEYQRKEKFYIFDIKQNQFIWVERSELGPMYGCKREKCTYCPCAYKMKSSTTLLRHLQVVETKFFCYLVIDKLEQSDDRNMKRIQKFVESIGTKNEELDVDDKADDKVDDDESESDVDNEYNDLRNNYEELEDESTDSEDRHEILTKLEESYKRSYEKMKSFFRKLKFKLNLTSLNRGVIDSQEQMILSKRMEDFQQKEKEFTFMKKVNLRYEDLDFLMKKHGVADDFEIDESNVTLVLQLKEEDCPSNEQQSISFASAKVLNLGSKEPRFSNDFNFSAPVGYLDEQNGNDEFENQVRLDNLPINRVGLRTNELNDESDHQNEEINEQTSNNQLVYEQLELVPASNDKELRLVPVDSESQSSFSKIKSILPKFIRIKKERVEDDAFDLIGCKRTKTC